MSTFSRHSHVFFPGLASDRQLLVANSAFKCFRIEVASREQDD